MSPVNAGLRAVAIAIAVAATLLIAAPGAHAQDAADPPPDPELERVDEMLAEARAEIREFRQADGDEDDPDHPGRRWADELWRFRADHPGTPAADRATTESIHFMLHAGQAEEAVARAAALPETDSAWPQLINILFEGSGLVDDYRRFVAKAEALSAAELDPEKWASLRFRIAQGHWVEGDFQSARAALAEIRSQAPSPDWAALVMTAREELGHPEIRDGERSWRSARDLWQRPGRIMEALGVGRGDRVADVGSGGGYFTFLLARRVGAGGEVHAVDINEDSLEKIAARAEELELEQVSTVLGADDDSRLPEGGVDAILIVDTYHEIAGFAGVMTSLFDALAPGGRLVIVDIPGELGEEREEYHRLHEIPAEVVIEEAADAGFRLDTFDRRFTGQPAGRRFFLVAFTKPAAAD